MVEHTPHQWSGGSLRTNFRRLFNFTTPADRALEVSRVDTVLVKIVWCLCVLSFAL
jgi:hypothetical protein